MKPFAVILMGSKADLDHCNKIAEACKQFGIETVTRIGSAHKTAEHALNILRTYEADPRPKVYITVAGRQRPGHCLPAAERFLRRGGCLLVFAHAFGRRPGPAAGTCQRGAVRGQILWSV